MSREQRTASSSGSASGGGPRTIESLSDASILSALFFSRSFSFSVHFSVPFFFSDLLMGQMDLPTILSKQRGMLQLCHKKGLIIPQAFFNIWIQAAEVSQRPGAARIGDPRSTASAARGASRLLARRLAARRVAVPPRAYLSTRPPAHQSLHAGSSARSLCVRVTAGMCE